MKSRRNFHGLWRFAFRPRVEILEDRCTPTHGVLRTIDLAIGQKEFWPGEYVDAAFVMPTDHNLDPGLETIVLGEHFEYRINVIEAGAHRLRVGLDSIP